jgi:hypothetical protein
MTTLTADQFSSQLDLTSKTILLPVETDAVAHYADRSDFPTTGRLKRLYIARDTGVLWAWTGTTYQVTSPTTDQFAALEGDLALAEAAIVTERTARQAAIVGEAQQRQAADEEINAFIAALAADLLTAQQATSGLNNRLTLAETALAEVPALIADSESFEQLDNYNDFPPTGRLNRLYLDKSNGALWRWTGTTYSPVPEEQDGGVY